MKSSGIKKGNYEAKSGPRKRKQSSLFRAQKKAKPRQKQTWDQTYLELAEYRKEHGHCNPVRGGPDDFLSQWTEKQRRNKHKLKSDQIRRLNQVNFDWRTRQEREDDQWNIQFEKVKAYKQQYGDEGFFLCHHQVHVVGSRMPLPHYRAIQQYRDCSCVQQ